MTERGARKLRNINFSIGIVHAGGCAVIIGKNRTRSFRTRWIRTIPGYGNAHSEPNDSSTGKDNISTGIYLYISFLRIHYLVVLALALCTTCKYQFVSRMYSLVWFKKKIVQIRKWRESESVNN